MRFTQAGTIYRNFLEDYCGPFIQRLIQRENRMFVAGGSLISLLDGEDPRDIDIYIPTLSPAHLLYMLTQYEETSVSTKPSYEFIIRKAGESSYDSINYRYLQYLESKGPQTKMHLIFCPFCDPMNVISGFDIDLCKIAIIGETMIQSQYAESDYLSRRINLSVVTEPLKTKERVHKFIKRGFNATPHTLEFLTKIGLEHSTDDAPEAATETERSIDALEVAIATETERLDALENPGAPLEIIPGTESIV